jgi:hypothetical protein
VTTTSGSRFRPAHPFRLRFPEREIRAWAGRYAFPGEDRIVAEVATRAKQRGHVTYEEFLEICRWKSPRSQPRCAANAPGLVEEVTRTALTAQHEELKIGALLVLSGVQWPTASVILHLCDQGRYPILDFRALWSLGYPDPPSYGFRFWSSYCDATRGLADRAGVSMRVLDRALWQYSKESQK